jgi:hypothetical protein
VSHFGINRQKGRKYEKPNYANWILETILSNFYTKWTTIKNKHETDDGSNSEK